MEVAINKLFNSLDWSEDITGTGSVTYLDNPENAQSAGDVVVCEGDSVSRAGVYYDFELTSGETVVFDVLARNIDGYTDTGSIYLEYPIGSRIQEINVSNFDWHQAESLIFTAPFNENFAAYKCRIFIGSSVTKPSGCEFYRPRLQKIGGIFAGRQTLMYGGVEITAGVYTFRGRGFNADTLIRNVATGEIEIRPHLEASSSLEGTINLTTIRATNAVKYIIEARYLVSTGRIAIGFFDNNTFASVDVNSLDGTQRFDFTVWL